MSSAAVSRRAAASGSRRAIQRSRSRARRPAARPPARETMTVRDLVSAARAIACRSAGSSAPRRPARLRAAVREHVGVVVGGQQRVDRDRHDAGVERAEERHRPVDGVVQAKQHALLAAQAQRRAAPRRAGATRASQLAVGQRRRDRRRRRALAARPALRRRTCPAKLNDPVAARQARSLFPPRLRSTLRSGTLMHVDRACQAL